MKALLYTFSFAALITIPMRGLSAEPNEPNTLKLHKVVFEVVVDTPEKWEAALRNVENVQKAFGAKTTKIEVVTHGKGVGMLLAKSAAANPELKSKVERLHGNGVVFAVCENTMGRMKISKEQLLPIATTVDSGVTEVIRKQEDEYAYIKSGD